MCSVHREVHFVVQLLLPLATRLLETVLEHGQRVQGEKGIEDLASRRKQNKCDSLSDTAKTCDRADIWTEVVHLCGNMLPITMRLALCFSSSSAELIVCLQIS